MSSHVANVACHSSHQLMVAPGKPTLLHPLFASLARPFPCPCRRCNTRPGRLPARPWCWNCRHLTRSQVRRSATTPGTVFIPLHARALRSHSELRHRRRVGSVVGTRRDGGRGWLPGFHLARPRQMVGIDPLPQGLCPTALPLESSRRLRAGNSSFR